MLQTMVDDVFMKMYKFCCQSILIVSGFDTEIMNIYTVYNDTNHLTCHFLNA